MVCQGVGGVRSDKCTHLPSAKPADSTNYYPLTLVGKSARHASVNQRSMTSRLLKKRPISWWSTVCSPKTPLWDTFVTTSAN